MSGQGRSPSPGSIETRFLRKYSFLIGAKYPRGFPPFIHQKMGVLKFSVYLYTCSPSAMPRLDLSGLFSGSPVTTFSTMSD